MKSSTSNLQDQPRMINSRYISAFQKETEPPEESHKPSKFISLPIRDQFQGNCLDAIADLDINFFSFPLSYNTRLNSVRKSRETKIVDVEKKKDQLVQHYKVLYNRNTEIERSINTYKSHLKERKKLNYDPLLLPNRGEAYAETITTASVNMRLSHLASLQMNSRCLEHSLPHNSKKSEQIRVKILPNYTQLDNRNSLNLTLEQSVSKTDDVTASMELPALDELKKSVILPKNLYRSRSELRKTFTSISSFRLRTPTRGGSKEKSTDFTEFRLRTSEDQDQYDLDKNGLSRDIGRNSDRVQMVSIFSVQGEKRALTPVLSGISGISLHQKSLPLQHSNSTKEELRTGVPVAANVKISKLSCSEVTPSTSGYKTAYFPYFGGGGMRHSRSCMRSSNTRSVGSLHKSLENGDISLKLSNQEKITDLETSNQQLLNENRQPIVATHSEESFKNNGLQKTTSFRVRSVKPELRASILEHT